MTPPVLLPAAVAVAAVALGLLLGLVPSGRARLVGPLRTFALAAALTVVLTHLLPEAFQQLGMPALLLFAATSAVPAWMALVSRLFGGHGEHRHAGLGAGYLGLLVHHVGDGLGLGAYGGATSGRAAHPDVLLALAVHTVPLVAVVAFAFRAKGGTRGAVMASAGLALASVVGVTASGFVPAPVVDTLSGWIAAGVAGLLVHVVTHDLGRDLPADTGSRLLDLFAAGLGVVTTLAGSEPELGDFLFGMRLSLLIMLQEVAPAVILAVLAAAVLSRLEHPTARRWLEPLPAPAYGLDGVFCAVALGGVRFGVLFFVGLLLVTRAIALRGGAAVERERERVPFVLDLVARFATLVPWVGAGLLVAALVRSVSFRNVPLPLALGGALLVALPSSMAASAGVLIAVAAAGAGLAPGVALAFALVASARPPGAEPGGASRGRSLWAVMATLLVGIGVGTTSTGARAAAPEQPVALVMAAVLLLALGTLFVAFQRGVRGILLALFPSHDTAPRPAHHE